MGGRGQGPYVRWGGGRRSTTRVPLVLLVHADDPGRVRDRMGHHELARAIARALRCRAAVAAVLAALGDERVEDLLARLEVRARVVDDAGERDHGRHVWRPEV